MSFTVEDVNGTPFTVDFHKTGARVSITVGKGLYKFSAQDAESLAAALDYHAMIAENVERFSDG